VPLDGGPCQKFSASVQAFLLQSRVRGLELRQRAERIRGTQSNDFTGDQESRRSGFQEEPLALLIFSSRFHLYPGTGSNDFKEIRRLGDLVLF
jgi:hypothetical protein